VVLCSPLTRAVQTATVGLRPLLAPQSTSPAPRREPLRLRLAADIRERRNLGGLDTVGTCPGQSVPGRVQRCLEKAVGADLASEYYGIIDAIDYDDVEEQWWDARPESPAAVEQRMGSFVGLLRALPQEQDSVIAIGHSHFFREVFRRYASADAGDFRTKVLSNCGVVAATFSFGEGLGTRIVAQRLIFSSALVERPGPLLSVLAGPAGPRWAVLSSLSIFVAECVRRLDLHATAAAVAAAGMGLLLAQALQRWLLPWRPEAVVLLWVLCSLLVRTLERAGGCAW